MRTTGTLCDSSAHKRRLIWDEDAAVIGFKVRVNITSSSYSYCQRTVARRAANNNPLSPYEI